MAGKMCDNERKNRIHKILELLKLGVPMSIIAKKHIGVSRQRLYVFLEENKVKIH